VLSKHDLCANPQSLSQLSVTAERYSGSFLDTQIGSAPWRAFGSTTLARLGRFSGRWPFKVPVASPANAVAQWSELVAKADVPSRAALY
jgi:hypothetical protein